MPFELRCESGALRGGPVLKFPDTGGAPPGVANAYTVLDGFFEYFSSLNLQGYKFGDDPEHRFRRYGRLFSTQP